MDEVMAKTTKKDKGSNVSSVGVAHGTHVDEVRMKSTKKTLVINVKGELEAKTIKI